MGHTEKPKSIDFDTFYAIADRDSELWTLIKRPTGKEYTEVREQLLQMYRDSKRSIQKRVANTGETLSRKEFSAQLIDKFKEYESLLAYMVFRD